MTAKLFRKLHGIFLQINSEIFLANLLIFLLCLLAYGLLIPWLGFYWDDWVFAWTIRFLGPREFIASFLPFRPLLGPIFTLTTSLIGDTPLAWQLFGLCIRILSGFAAFWSFRQIWPEARLQTLLAALFFVLFPAYNQQWVALTHANQELIPLICFLLSLGFMVKAVREPAHKFRWYLIALILAFWGLYPTEYFFGLEVLRPFILLFILQQNHSKRSSWFKRVWLAWLPFLLLWLFNGVFLYLYHRSPYYSSYGMTLISLSGSDIKTFILHTLEEIIHAIITPGFYAWGNTLALFTESLSKITTWLAIGLAAVSFCAAFRIISRLHLSDKNEASPSTFARQAITLGLIGMLAGRFPSWLADLPLEIAFSADRFMLSIMLGSSLFLIGLVDDLVQQTTRKILIACIFIALAVGWQFKAANTFRRDWDNQRQFFWQLSWRVPALEPGTLLITHELPLSYETDLSLTAPLNWVYAPQLDSHDLPYMLAYTKARLGSGILPGLKTGIPISASFRTMDFESTTDSVLVIYQEYPGCLRVMDPVYSDADTVPAVTYMLSDAIPLSNLDLILTAAPQPQLPRSLFGSEPDHAWCYYFEKAELGRQVGNWQEVARLGSVAFQNGLQALQPSELLVFIEGYANSGQVLEAVQLSQKVLNEKPELLPALCKLWQRVQRSYPTNRQIGDYRQSLCITDS